VSLLTFSADASERADPRSSSTSPFVMWPDVFASPFTPQKPYYTLSLAILGPSRFAGHILSSRLYCNPKALWKLNWFLRDFGHDTELLGGDEVDETQLVGLKGVVKISHVIFNFTSLLRLDRFAPADRWKDRSPANLDNPQVA
jgi:hypothetical protein